MSLISTIKVADTASTQKVPSISYEDRGVSEANILTNMLGGDATSDPKKLYPKGKVTVRTLIRKSKGGVIHTNVNLKRSEPTGNVAKNPATNDLYVQNVKNVLSTLSVSLSLPASVAKDPVLLAALKTAILKDGTSIVTALSTEIEELLLAN